jgi:signal transduction histidine kinase
MSRTGAWLKFAAADFRPITAVMTTGLAFSIILFLLTRGYYFEADRQQFQLDTANYGTNFTSDVDRHINSLAAIRAFVSTSDKVTRWEFSNFAHEILPRNSGFKAVFWLPHTGQAQRNAFEVGLQRDGLYGLRLREMTGTGQLVDAKARPVYLPVTYVEPFEGTSNLIGVDLLHSPIYGPLFDAAERAGKVVVSEPIDHALVGGAESPMVLVVFPLIGEADPKNGAASKEPQGYVLGVLQLNRIIEDSIGPRAPVRAAIAYGPTRSVYIAGARERVMDLSRWFVDAEFSQVEPFTVAGKQFFLAMRVTQNGNALTRLYAPAGVAALVLALTILLAQSMLTTTMRKREVEGAVLERTFELCQINDVLNVEIGQRRLLEAELRLSKEKAEAANRAKSAFLSTMSHELRTPLNAIIGFSSLLGDQPDAFNDRSDEYLHEINDSGVRLLHLINDILEITQMDTEETGPGQLVYLSDLVDTVMVEMQPHAHEAGVCLQSNLAEPLRALRGDGRRLQRALHHLVSNAIKFTERGGWAKIAVHSGPNGLIVEVSDNGVGMPPGAEAKLIASFSQYDSSLARTREGVGLGLTFVRRVADHHGAVLQIFSELGKGTRVVMDFPADRIVKAREAA